MSAKLNFKGIVHIIKDYIFLVLVFFILRLYGITDPPLEIQHSWRQCTGLMIARNFLHIDANILYPRIDDLCSSSDIVAFEFQLLSYLHYLVSLIFGYEHWYGRMINLFISSLGTLSFGFLINRFSNSKFYLNQTNRYKLINRINRYNILKKKIALLKYNDCLEKKDFDGEKGYTIRNIINLVKKIGSKSKYGNIYLTSIPNTLGPYPIATKVMKIDNDNILEINIMTKITSNIILKKLSKHFLMIYGSCSCTNKIAEKLKLISINELADGDLKVLLTDRELLQNQELLFNLIFQTFISIGTYHNLVGYIHGDSHYGNFLFQQNNEVGYYHYVFNGIDYYLKSCKWNIIIFDYGFSKKINNVNSTLHIKKINKDIFEDYRRIIHAFMNKKSGWGHYKNLPNSQTNDMILEITSILDKIIYLELTSQVATLSKTFSITLFKSIIDDVFLKYTPKDMFITARPPNVINESPFIIG